jgi:hypothetical protein
MYGIIRRIGDTLSTTIPSERLNSMATDDTRTRRDIKWRVRRGWVLGLGLWLGLFASGCESAIPGEGLCPGSAELTEDCESGRGFGAVVVRWRIADISLGRLLSRGLCCCNANPSRDGIDRQQCGNIGSSCLESPAWLVERINLTLRSVSDGRRYSWDVACTEGEFTTPYCIAPGTYDMQLTATVNTIDSLQPDRFACSPKSAASPPQVRREVVSGQATNLDAVVLGINAP